MPDLTVEYYWCCPSEIFWEIEVKGSQTYLVRWGETGHKTREVSHNYSCTCPAYKYGDGSYCKHIKQVKGLRCHYNELVDGPVGPNNTCPKCGRACVCIPYAV